MSWRVRIEPYGRSAPNDCPWEDWALPHDASRQAIHAVVHEMAFQAPLHIYTPSAEAPTYRLLVQMLEDIGMNADHYDVHIEEKEPDAHGGSAVYQ